MSIRNELLDGLESLAARPVTLSELAARPQLADAVALRHDVDHDLDLALELAAAQHGRGLRATYFLLHTAPYWNDPLFDAKVRQLGAYGHEIGLHVNVLTEWFDGTVNDPPSRLAEVLARLRSTGVSVVGTSAHGDKRCYERQFINYWIWRELRGSDPASTERGRTPEGVRTDDREREIAYPESETIRREDGAILRLWDVSQADHGIEYEAVRVPSDRYWSDTGGRWTPDNPFEADLGRGRHQILIHPWWWRGERRSVFVVSPARSGSKWLTKTVDVLGSATALHDWTLNHERDGDGFPHVHRTRFGYRAMVKDHPLAEKLINAGLTYHLLTQRHVVEANTYLEPFVEEVRRQMPDVTILHLHRDGREVVRSILDRGWYATPLDPAHRDVPLWRWAKLSQFERACWYFRYTQERLLALADRRLRFEDAISDEGYLAEFADDLGITFHPLLVEHLRATVDATQTFNVPPFDRWPPHAQRVFAEICGPVQERFGYGVASRSERGLPARLSERSLTARLFGRSLKTRLLGRSHRLRSAERSLRERFSRWSLSEQPDPRKRSSLALDNLVATPCGMGITRRGQRLEMSSQAGSRSNRFVMLARGEASWRATDPEASLRSRRDRWAHCAATVEAVTGTVRIFALFYDDAGQLTAQKEVFLVNEPGEVEFALAPPAACGGFALGLHFGSAQPAGLAIRDFSLRWAGFPRRYRWEEWL